MPGNSTLVPYECKMRSCQRKRDELKTKFREDLLVCRGMYGIELIEYLVSLEDKYDVV